MSPIKSNFSKENPAKSMTWRDPESIKRSGGGVSEQEFEMRDEPASQTPVLRTTGRPRSKPFDGPGEGQSQIDPETQTSKALTRFT